MEEMEDMTEEASSSGMQVNQNGRIKEVSTRCLAPQSVMELLNENPKRMPTHMLIGDYVFYIGSKRSPNKDGTIYYRCLSRGDKVANGQLVPGCPVFLRMDVYTGECVITREHNGHKKPNLDGFKTGYVTWTPAQAPSGVENGNADLMSGYRAWRAVEVAEDAATGLFLVPHSVRTKLNETPKLIPSHLVFGEYVFARAGTKPMKNGRMRFRCQQADTARNGRRVYVCSASLHLNIDTGECHFPAEHSDHKKPNLDAILIRFVAWPPVQEQPEAEVDGAEQTSDLQSVDVTDHTGPFPVPQSVMAGLSETPKRIPKTLTFGRYAYSVTKACVPKNGEVHYHCQQRWTTKKGCPVQQCFATLKLNIHTGECYNTSVQKHSVHKRPKRPVANSIDYFTWQPVERPLVDPVALSDKWTTGVDETALAWFKLSKSEIEMLDETPKRIPTRVEFAGYVFVPMRRKPSVDGVMRYHCQQRWFYPHGNSAPILRCAVKVHLDVYSGDCAVFGEHSVHDKPQCDASTPGYITWRPLEQQQRVIEFPAKIVVDGYVFNASRNPEAKSIKNGIKSYQCQQYDAVRCRAKLTLNTITGEQKIIGVHSGHSTPYALGSRNLQGELQLSAGKSVVLGVTHPVCSECGRCLTRNHECILKKVPELAEATDRPFRDGTIAQHATQYCSCANQTQPLTAELRDIPAFLVDACTSHGTLEQLLNDDGVTRFIEFNRTVVDGLSSDVPVARVVYLLLVGTEGVPIPESEFPQRVFYVGQRSTVSGGLEHRLRSYVAGLRTHRWNKNNLLLLRELKNAKASRQSVLMVRISLTACGQKADVFASHLLESMMILSFGFRNLANIELSLNAVDLERYDAFPAFREALAQSRKVTASAIGCLARRFAMPRWKLSTSEANMSDYFMRHEPHLFIELLSTPIQAVSLSSDTLQEVRAFRPTAGPCGFGTMLSATEVALYSALVVHSAGGRVAAIRPDALVNDCGGISESACYVISGKVDTLLLPRWVPPKESYTTTGHWTFYGFDVSKKRLIYCEPAEDVSPSISSLREVRGLVKAALSGSGWDGSMDTLLVQTSSVVNESLRSDILLCICLEQFASSRSLETVGCSDWDHIRISIRTTLKLTQSADAGIDFRPIFACLQMAHSPNVDASEQSESDRDSDESSTSDDDSCGSNEDADGRIYRQSESDRDSDEFSISGDDSCGSNEDADDSTSFTDGVTRDRPNQDESFRSGCKVLTGIDFDLPSTSAKCVVSNPSIGTKRPLRTDEDCPGLNKSLKIERIGEGSLTFDHDAVKWPNAMRERSTSFFEVYDNSADLFMEPFGASPSSSRDWEVEVQSTLLATIRDSEDGDESVPVSVGEPLASSSLTLSSKFCLPFFMEPFGASPSTSRDWKAEVQPTLSATSISLVREAKAQPSLSDTPISLVREAKAQPSLSDTSISLVREAEVQPTLSASSRDSEDDTASLTLASKLSLPFFLEPFSDSPSNSRNLEAGVPPTLSDGGRDSEDGDESVHVSVEEPRVFDVLMPFSEFSLPCFMEPFGALPFNSRDWEAEVPPKL